MTGVVATSLGAEFVPRLDEGELSLDIKRLPSISITEAQRLGVEVEEVLARFPEVQSVVTRTGRAEVATDPVGPDETEVMVKLRAQGGVDDRARSRRAWARRSSRRSRARCRRPSCRCRSRSRIASTSCWPARAPTSSSRCSARTSTVLKKTADEIGKVVRDIPGRGDWRVQRVLGPAAARGQARSPAAGALRHERRPRAGGGRGVARRALLRARSSRARGASI